MTSLRVFFGSIGPDLNNSLLHLGDGSPFLINEMTGWEGRPQTDMSYVMKPQRHGAWHTDIIAQPRVITLAVGVVTSNFNNQQGQYNTEHRQRLIDFFGITSQEFYFGVDMGYGKRIEYVFGRITDFRMNTSGFYQKQAIALIEITASDPRKFIGDPRELNSSLKSIKATLGDTVTSTSSYPYTYSFLYAGYSATILGKNYMPNPAMRSVIKNVSYYENVVTNPSFETAGSAVEVRRNLITNPSFETNLTGWTAGTAWSLSQSTAKINYGTYSMRAARLNTTPGNGTATISFSQTSGKVYSASVWFSGGVGKYSLKAGNSATVEFQAQANWEVVTVTWTASTTSTTTLVISDTPNTSPISGTGSWIYFDGIMVEEATVPGEYFSGSSPATADHTYAWTGTAGLSTSIEQALSIGGWASANASSKIWQSKQNFRSGLASMKVSTQGLSAGEGATQTAPSKTGWSTGDPVTASVWVKGTAGVAINLTLATTGGSQTVSSYYLDGNWRNLVVTGTIDAGSTSGPFVSIKTTIQNRVIMYIDDLLIEKSPVLHDYFDGSIPDTTDYDYQWVGATNASASRKYVPTVSTYTPANAMPLEAALDLNGNPTLQIIPIGASNDTYASSVVSAENIALLAGKIAYALGRVYIPTALQGSLNANALKIGMIIGSPTMPATIWSVAAPNVAQQYATVSLSAAIPSDVTSITIIYMNGASRGNGIVLWDRVQLTDSSTLALDYFDGNSVGVYSDRSVGYWESTADSGTSVLILSTLPQNSIQFTVEGNTAARTLYTVNGDITNPRITITDKRGTKSIWVQAKLIATPNGTDGITGALTIDPYNGTVSIGSSSAMHLVRGSSPYDLDLFPGDTSIELSGENANANLTITWAPAIL